MRHLRKKLLILLIFIGLGIFLVSCYPGGDQTYSDYDLVFSNYDQNFDFTQVHTYYMPDSVVHILDTLNPQDNISRIYDGAILSEIEKDMTARGYVRLPQIDDQNQPDAILTAVAFTVTVNSISYWDPYYYWGYDPWWDYYPWWGPGYDYWYPWGDVVVVSSYDVGTLLMIMQDPKHPDITNKKIPVEWIGGINGLMGDTKTSTQQRITKGIDQAFIQSPYLGR